MRIAVVGATGLVGSTMLKVLEERCFPLTELLPVASARSAGKQLSFQGQSWPVLTLEEALERRPEFALFSAGGSVSLEWAPRFAEAGCRVIDNSSAWRMDPGKKLIVPEVNGDVLTPADRIIANPNCSTIQMVMVLHPLHRRYGIRRVVASTYQSVTGSGQKGMDQLNGEESDQPGAPFYPHPIRHNLIPHIDVFGDNGYTKEEMKMVMETCKILGDEAIRVTATCVRVPVMGGHSESLNIELAQDFNQGELKALLGAMPGVQVVDDAAANQYPMPLFAQGKDDVFVGRIRRDESQPNTLNCWVVADNLRKGAATNAVQILETLVR